ncbi:MAG: hypothetical protein R2714_08895 [Microthrixaceae bacterium]
MKSDSPSPLDHLRDPLADPVLDRRRVRLGLMLVGTGLMHFLAPGPFRRIVPGWFPWPDGAVAVSGAAEILSGSLMAHPRTQRLGGALPPARWWRCIRRTSRWRWMLPVAGVGAPGRGYPDRPGGWR